MKHRLAVWGILAFGGVSWQLAQAETVLLADAGVKAVLQYAVANGVWTLEKNFASGSYSNSVLQPFGVACDGRHVYVGDIGAARRILKFGLDGALSGVLTNFDSTVMPECLTFAPDGRLYMSDAFGSAGDKVYRFNLATGAGGVLINTTGWGSTLNNPRGLVADENGFLYVADRNANVIRRFVADTGVYTGNFFSVSSPQGLAYDYALKNLYAVVTEGPNQRVYTLRTNGYYQVISASATTSPGIGALKLGNDFYYSSYAEKTIFRIDASGNRTTVVDAGLNQPGYLAVIPRQPICSDDGLVAQWRFNDVTNSLWIESSVGMAGLHRIQAKGTLQVGARGVEGGAAWFNAYSRGEILDSAALLASNSDFSVFMWMGVTNTANAQRHLFSCNGGQANRCELGIDYDASSLKKLFWWHSGGVTLISTNDVRDGKWHHVGVIRRANNFELWVDGAVATNAASSAPISQAVNWRIGASAWETTFFLMSGGFMDDLRVYNRALEANEVAAVYTAFTSGPGALAAPEKPVAPAADFRQSESDLACKVVAGQPGIGEIVGSPSFVILSDGTYVAAHDLNGDTLAHTRVNRSLDKGVTWSSGVDVNNLTQASLFTDGGKLYLFGTQAETGNVRVHRSDDGGLTWTSGATVSPTNIFRTAAGPVVSQGGRLWKATEDVGGSGVWPASARVRIFSAPEGTDLTAAGSWTCSSPLSPSGFSTARRFTAWLDGNLAVDRKGVLVDLLRTVQSQGGTPEAVAVVAVTNASSAPVFEVSPNLTMLPGGAKPFNVRYDAMSGRYWTVVNSVVTNDDPAGVLLPDTLRNRLALYSSYSLRDWCFHTNLVYSGDLFRYGFQKAAFAVDGDDLVVLAAAAYEDGISGPRGPDQPNQLICLKIHGFRDIPVDKGPARVLVADAGANRVVRLCPNSLGQWCEDGLFGASCPMTAPHGMACSGETVYVCEAVAGGRVLAFTRKGVFRGVVTQFPSANVPDALAASADGMLYVSDAFGSSGDKIFRVNPSLGAREVFVDTTGWGGTLIDPRGVACDGDGNVYVADYQTATGDGRIRKFSSGGVLLASSSAVDRPRGVFWDASQTRLLGSVFGACDLYQYSADLQSSAKIGDYSTWTQYLGLGVVDSTVCFSNYDQGLVHWLKGYSSQGTIASGLKSPAHFIYLSEGGTAYPDAILGTCVRIR